MTRNVIAVACSAVVLGVIAITLLGAKPSVAIGPKAPNFSLKGSDGKTYTLQSFTSKGDVVFYFIGNSCPVNAEAVKYYNTISKAYQGKATFVGVIDGDMKVYKDWQGAFKAPYLVLLDPKMTMIESYRAERSPWVIHVTKTGEIGKVWRGYSKNYLTELSKTLAAIGKTKVVSIDMKGAPGDATYG